jgi:2-haloacid dehalogenase
MPPKPAPVLVFDVNETLLDLQALEPVFESVFGEARALRDWFSELILYSQTLTLTGCYRPFNELAAAVLRMRGEVTGVAVSDADVAALGEAIRAMPAHEDAAAGLTRLQEAGLRLVTLTNAPPAAGPSPLDKAGIAHFFEAHFSVDEVRQFKPAAAVYRRVASHLGVELGDLCLVACHVWDTIGAQAAGCQGAFIRRPGNAVLHIRDTPAPDFTADDLHNLATQMGCP